MLLPWKRFFQSYISPSFMSLIVFEGIIDSCLDNLRRETTVVSFSVSLLLGLPIQSHHATFVYRLILFFLSRPILLSLSDRYTKQTFVVSVSIRTFFSLLWLKVESFRDKSDRFVSLSVYFAFEIATCEKQTKDSRALSFGIKPATSKLAIKEVI